MNRLETAFDRARRHGTPALIPFLTAGDPDLESTVRLVAALERSGADVIELGVPFSDPMADGPVIQTASERALEQGTTLAKILDTVRAIRRESAIPLVLMGYYNPILSYGPQRFVADAVAAGVDGLLLVDLPPEERQELAAWSTPAGLPLITLIAPTTPPARRLELAAQAEGFLYFVSMTGVTGVARIDTSAVAAEVAALRQAAPVPVAVGFGISTPGDAAAVGAFADAVVVGSALVKIIAACGNSPELLPSVEAFIRSLRAGLDTSRANA